MNSDACVGFVVSSYATTSAQPLALPTTETTKGKGKAETTHDINDRNDQPPVFFGETTDATPAVGFPSLRDNDESQGSRRVYGRRGPIVLLPHEKRCSPCGRMLPLSEFTSDKSKRSGVGTYCRECEAARSRKRYARDRKAILAKAAAKRGPKPFRFCSECGELLEGAQRVTCGTSRCRDRRFKRMHPVQYAAREAAKVERRREARRRAREGGA